MKPREGHELASERACPRRNGSESKQGARVGPLVRICANPIIRIVSFSRGGGGRR